MGKIITQKLGIRLQILVICSSNILQIITRSFLGKAIVVAFLYFLSYMLCSTMLMWFTLLFQCN